MFSSILGIVISICFSRVVASSAASLHGADSQSHDEQNEVTEGFVLFQSHSTIVPGAKTTHFDEFLDLADDFDGNSEDKVRTSSDAKEEVYATGVDALPELLQDVRIAPRRKTTSRWLALTPRLPSSLRLRTFLQELLVVALGLVGYFICRGWPVPSFSGLVSKTPSSSEAACTPKMTKEMSLDIDELVQAMYTDNKEHLQELLQERSANASDEVWGCTALHAAAHCGCASAAEALLLRGACANMKDTWDETPLHFAARSGSRQVAELLITYGANFNAVNAHDWTPLVVAARAGHEEVCELLLSHGAGVGGLTDKDLPPVLTSLLVRNMVKSIANRNDATKLKSC